MKISYLFLVVTFLSNCAPIEPRSAPKIDPNSTTNVNVDTEPEAIFDISVADAEANRALALRYSFAAVCQPLFNPTDSSPDTEGGILTNDDNETADLGLEEDCWEGPSVAIPTTFAALSGSLDSSKAACLSAGRFWDARGAGTCFDVDEMKLDCDYGELKSDLSAIEGINRFLTGYQTLGWRVEQCAMIGDEPYLHVSTVVVKRDEVHYVAKIAFLRGLGEVCEGKSGGACDNAAENPDAKVLFVSSPQGIASVRITDLGLEKKSLIPGDGT